MKARVHVMLKNGVWTRKGKRYAMRLGAMGFDGVQGVRQGKVIELDLADDATEARWQDMCDKLLANTVIESYRWRCADARSGCCLSRVKL